MTSKGCTLAAVSVGGRHSRCGRSDCREWSEEASTEHQARNLAEEIIEDRSVENEDEDAINANLTGLPS